MADDLNKKGNGGNVSYVEFSSFDKKKYAGYVPCANYLSYVYSSLIEECVPFTGQLVFMTNGVVLKGDHSFKIIKHMGRTNETVINEYEEIRMQELAHTKTLKELSDNFESVMESYRRCGFDKLI